MAFKKGTSGNPQGRPKGIEDRRTAARALFEARADELIEAAITRALSGDVAALRLCLDRIAPPIKAIDVPIFLPTLSGSIADQGRAIVGALARGEMTPDQAAQIMTTIAALGKIVEGEELERRVAALEMANANADGANRAA